MKYLLLFLIRTYQLTLSALIGRRCRYLPTCSDYARHAIEKHGAWRGFLLGWRVCRAAIPGAGTGLIRCRKPMRGRSGGKRKGAREGP